jgi:hypothetical protein
MKNPRMTCSARELDAFSNYFDYNKMKFFKAERTCIVHLLIHNLLQSETLQLVWLSVQAHVRHNLVMCQHLCSLDLTYI